MLLSRENRHEAAWGGFLRMKQANKQSYEEDLNSTLRKFKKDLGVRDGTPSLRSAKRMRHRRQPAAASRPPQLGNGLCRCACPIG